MSLVTEVGVDAATGQRKKKSRKRSAPSHSAEAEEEDPPSEGAELAVKKAKQLE